jgi:outer membrane protein OmpA-like peptidoglycan-associated protein
MSVLGFNPADLSTMIDTLLDPKVARPIKVFVDPELGHLWRIIDPLSPTENMPVVKEWSKNVKYEVTIEGETRITRTPREEKVPGTPLGTLLEVIPDSHFDFDRSRLKPRQTEPQRLRDIAQQEIQEGGHEGLELWFLLFGHADMVGREEYNHDLTARRAESVARAIQMASGARLLPDVPRFGIRCSEFNPETGPNDNEWHDRRTPDDNGITGNPANRRVEIFAVRDRADKSTLTRVLQEAHAAALQGHPNAGRIRTWWTEGTFPCPHSKGDISRCKDLVRTETGEQDRPRPYCPFYREFKKGIKEAMCTPETTRTVYDEKVTKDKDRKEERTRVEGEYQPPPGEHFGFNMRNMMRGLKGLQPGFAPEVAVAPNKEEDAEDFNLIKAGPVKVVKLDLGFWGDRRVLDSSRSAGFRREPARSFGVIEGPFVWLCFFETKENADNPEAFTTKPEEVDERMNPRFARFVQAVADAGFRVRIEKKAVAEDGPANDRLRFFFPDMHLPRKFNEKDAEYSSGGCEKSTEILKSVLLDSLLCDYRLRVSQTPWLSAADRVKCAEFFEHGAKSLKLPLHSTGRKFSGVTDTADIPWLKVLPDAAQQIVLFLRKGGYYLFKFTREDLRREVPRLGGLYPDKGRGRTKDTLACWFYGQLGDRNVKTESGKSGPDWQQLIPGPAKELLQRSTLLDSPDAGKPQEASDKEKEQIDAGPARDLLRLLKVIKDYSEADGDNKVRVYHTGDLYETWADRRFLFEDFSETDDPAQQIPGLMQSLVSKKGSGAFVSFLKDSVKWILRTLLAGLDSADVDVFHRREVKKRFPEGEAHTETASELQTPDATLFGAGGPSFTSPVARSETRITHEQLAGRQYVAEQAAKRKALIAEFAAPVRTDAEGRAEDEELLGADHRGDQGFWNKAIIKAFDSAPEAAILYGNHDCYMGLHGGRARGFHTERNLWAEHGHRFEDSNVDGQPFGAFITNFTVDVLELPTYEGILDEFHMHREQDLFQPGLMLWHLMAEYGVDQLAERQEGQPPPPKVEPFRIAVNAHTHAADLVVAEIIFQKKEATKLGLITDAGAYAKLLASFIPWLIDLIDNWDERYSAFKGAWEDWFNGVKDRFSDFGEDFFGGLDECVGKAADFIKQTGEGVRDKLEDEWNQAKNKAGDVARGARDRLDDFKPPGL